MVLPETIGPRHQLPLEILVVFHQNQGTNSSQYLNSSMKKSNYLGKSECDCPAKLRETGNDDLIQRIQTERSLKIEKGREINET